MHTYGAFENIITKAVRIGYHDDGLKLMKMFYGKHGLYTPIMPLKFMVVTFFSSSTGTCLLLLLIFF
jgi:hypothetical protein